MILVGPGLDLSQLFKIELELDDLMLPYKMDLAIYDQIENNELVNHIDRVGVVFFQRMSVAFMDLWIGGSMCHVEGVFG